MAAVSPTPTHTILSPKTHLHLQPPPPPSLIKIASSPHQCRLKKLLTRSSSPNSVVSNPLEPLQSVPHQEPVASGPLGVASHSSQTPQELHSRRTILLSGALRASVAAAAAAAVLFSGSCDALEERASVGTESSSQSGSMGRSSSELGSTGSVQKGLINTEDWYRFQGEGFAISVPPDFEDITEPEDFSAGSSLYGERAKVRTYAARFASSDRSEILSVVIRQASQLKLSFFETKDITDLGSIRETAGIFLPGGAKLYAARTIKSMESDPSRTYYFYEFFSQDKHIAMEAAASNGKIFVVGVTAPQSKWKDDGRKLRSAAASFSLSQT